jgi:threonine/homoserine/homoserine lactone efflux protein
MTSGTYVAFAGALFLMVITPGPGILACVSRSLTSGFKMAAFVALGIITGDVIFVLTALYGLAAVADLMGEVFVIVKYLGAIYLIWLGYRTWMSDDTINAVEDRTGSSPVSCYLSGLCITLGNPKAIVFYLSFFPAFIDLSCVEASDIVKTLVIVLCVLTTVLSAYSLGASRVRRVFRSRRAFRNMKRCSGGAMISAGVMMVLRE